MFEDDMNVKLVAMKTNLLWLFVFCTFVMGGCVKQEHKEPRVYYYAYAADTTKNADKRIAELELRVKCAEVEMAKYHAVQEDNYSAMRDICDTTIMIIICIVTLIVAVAGVFAPYMFNKRIRDEFKDRLDKLNVDIATLNNEIQKTKRINLDIKRIETGLIEIKSKIEESEKAAEDAKRNAELSARQSQANKMFSEALNEKDVNKKINLNSKTIDYIKELLDLYCGDLDEEMQAKIEDLQETLTLSYYNRGVGYSNIEDMNSAIDDYNKAIELDPNCFDALNNLACAIVCVDGDLQEALKHANTVVRIKPNDGVFLDTRGSVYLAMGNMENALRDFKKAIDEFKSDIYEHFENRAKCYRLMAQKEPDEVKRSEYEHLATKDEAKSKELKTQMDLKE